MIEPTAGPAKVGPVLLYRGRVKPPFQGRYFFLKGAQICPASFGESLLL